MPPNFNTQPYFIKTCPYSIKTYPYSLHFYVLWTIHIVNINEWTNKNTVVRNLDKFETITERDLNTILIMKIWLRNNGATPTQHKRTKRQTRFCNTKTPMISARKSDGNGMADKRVFSPSGLARNLAPLRAAFCGIGFVFMQRRAVVLRARTRVHLYQRLRHV